MPALDKLFYLNIGPSGSFQPSGNPAYDSVPNDMDNVYRYLVDNNIQKIVLYCHGGLVNEEAGMDTARRITTLIQPIEKSHSICLVWETGFIETIRQNLGTIHSTAFFQKLLIKILKITGKKLGIDLDTPGISRGVEQLSESEVKAELEKEAPFENYSVNYAKRSVTYTKDQLAFTLEAEITAEMEEELEGDVEFDAAIEILPTEPAAAQPDLNKLTDEIAPGSRSLINLANVVITAVKITIAVIKRHIHKTDNGFYPTIIEEILRELYIANFGAWLWSGMKTKAEEMWLPDINGTTGLDQKAGNYLLKLIKKYCDDNPGVTVDLVGHSAGAIVVCQLIKQLEIRNLRLPLRNIIFMAPACRCELFHDTVLKNKGAFQNFRMFTMKDEWEKKDRLANGIYTRSLLYFITGLLEDEGKHPGAWILGLEKQYNNIPPYQESEIISDIRNYLLTDGTRLVRSKTGDNPGAGLASLAIKHGDFDNEGEITLQSIKEMINGH